MMVKDDYEAYCDVADRAAGVKFQEMHLIFSKTPDPLADFYFITIQVCFCVHICFGCRRSRRFTTLTPLHNAHAASQRSRRFRLVTRKK